VTSDAGVSATAVVLLVATVSLGAAGISIDLWRALAAHRDLVALADGAATAGATAIDAAALYADATDLVLDPYEARSRACGHLADHHPTVRCGGHATVSVAPQRVDVAVEADVPLTLMRLLSGDASGSSLTVRAESTAVVIRRPAPP
jgi:hypothetical protein